jgi:hypothetical protein
MIPFRRHLGGKGWGLNQVLAHAIYLLYYRAIQLQTLTNNAEMADYGNREISYSQGEDEGRRKVSLAIKGNEGSM